MEADAVSAVALGIVCPMANEGKEASPFVRAVLDQCQGFRWVRFFAVVDTVSTDDTLARLRDLAERPTSRLCVVWAADNRGHRRCLRARLPGSISGG